MTEPAAGARLFAPNNRTLSMTDAIPVIDVSDFLAAKPGALAAAAAKLRHACEEVGFFFLQGHGVPWEVIENAFEASRRFHALPSR